MAAVGGVVREGRGRLGAWIFSKKNQVFSTKKKRKKKRKRGIFGVVFFLSSPHFVRVLDSYILFIGLVITRLPVRDAVIDGFVTVIPAVSPRRVPGSKIKQLLFFF
jgi:hypothetical protein